MNLREDNSSEELTAQAYQILKNPMMMEIFEELTELWVSQIFDVTKTPEAREGICNQKRGMDMVLARLNSFISEYEIQQATNASN